MKSLINILFSLALMILVGGCSKKSFSIVPLAEEKKEDISQKPIDFVKYKDAKVDILFVIDNSGSMANVQRELSSNVSFFANEITASTLLDYHIGVVSTDMDSRYESGRLQGLPTFVTRTTPNANLTLSQHMLLGTDGSFSELMFDPVIAALTDPLLSKENAGFFRKDAFLAIIFITDAGDQSRQSVQDFSKALLQIKGDYSKILSYGVILTAQYATLCNNSGDDLNPKLEQFLNSVQNSNPAHDNILSLCSPDYGKRLADFAKDIVNRASSSIYLDRVPDVKTIRVTYGTQVIPNSLVQGWVYQNSSNSIILSSDIVYLNQTPTPSLKIEYKTLNL